MYHITANGTEMGTLIYSKEIDNKVWYTGP